MEISVEELTKRKVKMQGDIAGLRQRIMVQSQTVSRLEGAILCIDEIIAEGEKKDTKIVSMKPKIKIL